MSYRNDPYHPDYLKMYPCLKNRPDVLKVLTQSDRKMKYIEKDLKMILSVWIRRAMPSNTSPAEKYPLKA